MPRIGKDERVTFPGSSLSAFEGASQLRVPATMELSHLPGVSYRIVIDGFQPATPASLARIEGKFADDIDTVTCPRGFEGPVQQIGSIVVGNMNAK